MRKFLIPLLMASAVLPAAALAEPGDRGVRSHGERSESNDNSSQSRPQRSQHVERSSSDAPRVHIERTGGADRAQRSVDVQTSEPTRVRRFQRHQDAQPEQQVSEPVQQVADPVQRVRRTDRRDGFVGAIREVGEDGAAGRRGEVVVHRDGDHDGDHRWDGDRDGRHRWDRDWRRDARYNWSGYRNRYGSLFRLGRYYDPYGWNYRRFSIGFSMWPSYYGSNYWLNDPWQYRLPPAYGPYRWVRYYDDALLVNIYTGQVVDVIHNVFW